MDLRQLRTFRTVAELGSLSKASDRLRIAQPALSRQIKLLEHELKTPLFVRHGRGMMPTDAGRVLFDRTGTVVRQLEKAREDVLSIAGTPCGRVVVGMVPTIGSALALILARSVVRDLPGISLRLVEAFGGYLIDGLHRGEIDMAVVYGPATGLHLDAETLRYDDLCAVGATGWELNADGVVDLAWLSNQPLVLPSLPHALRVLIDDAFGALGLDTRVVVEADSFGAMLDIVAGGIGITLLPRYAVAEQIDAGRLVASQVVPALRRELVLALPSRQLASTAANAVAEIARREATGLGIVDHGSAIVRA